jgi:hypothetical protein
MGVRLRVSNPNLVEDLLLFMERRGCPARQLGVDLIEVEVPHAIHTEQARMELDLYLNVWKKLRAASLFEIEASRPRNPRGVDEEPGASAAHLHVI